MPQVQPPAMPTIEDIQTDLGKLGTISDPIAFPSAGATRIM
jgi:hypothetical protein